MKNSKVNNTKVAIDEHKAEVHHKELSFIRKWIFSTDHKVISKQYLWTALFMLFIGGGLAMLMRWQLGYPGKPLEFLGKILPEGMPEGIMVPEFYNALFTMHGTIMVFFVIVPILFGAFGNYLIPLQIGTHDMAFPTLNMMSYWVFLPSALTMLAAFFMEGGAAGAGWTSYAPLSALSLAFPGSGGGQTLWCIGLLIMGASSIMGAINFITTVVNLRAPGLTMMRLPLTIWALFITSILLLLATPVLAAALVMLLFDKLAGTSFFLPAGLVVADIPLTNSGGQPLLWQHLFWFFGHPEVYILILPAMGVTSEIISVFSRKPVFGYKAMVFSLIAIAFLGFIVWGHHMFVSGMNPTLGTSFMLSTLVIAVPSAIKVFNWLGTLWRGSIKLTTPMLNALAFVSMFVIGGLTGVFLAATPVDIYLHDTYFVVGHLHYVIFGGSLFGAFAALYFWFPKMFGKMMNETLGKIHFVLTFIFFNCVMFPMFILGIGGMPRRIYGYMEYAHLQHFQPMNEFMTISAFILGAAQLIFIFNFVWSMIKGKKAENNPWKSNTLEWTIPSPPPHLNYAIVPTVYHGPYEYSHPDAKEDYLPQSQPLNGEKVQAPHAEKG